MAMFATYFNLACKFASMILLLMALYRSENIFIKARTRDVREILAPNVLKYETSVRIKLIGKFILSILFIFISLSRIDHGCRYISNTDMIVWIIISVVFLIIAYQDYRFSSPENED